MSDFHKGPPSDFLSQTFGPRPNVLLARLPWDISPWYRFFQHVCNDVSNRLLLPSQIPYLWDTSVWVRDRQGDSVSVSGFWPGSLACVLHHCSLPPNRSVRQRKGNKPSVWIQSVGWTFWRCNWSRLAAGGISSQITGSTLLLLGQHLEMRNVSLKSLLRW